MIYCWEDNKHTRFVLRKSNTRQMLHWTMRHFLRWGHMLFPTSHAFIPVCGEMDTSVEIPACVTRWIIWEKLILNDVFLRSQKNLICLSWGVFFPFHFFFLFSCKHSHKCECLGLELVSSQRPTVAMEMSPVCGADTRAGVFVGTGGFNHPTPLISLLLSGEMPVIHNSVTLLRNVSSDRFYL